MIKPFDKNIKLNKYYNITSNGQMSNFNKLLEEEFGFSCVSNFAGQPLNSKYANTKKFNKFIRDHKYEFSFLQRAIHKASKKSNDTCSYVYVSDKRLELAMVMDNNLGDESFITFYISNRYSYDVDYKKEIDTFLEEIKRTCTKKVLHKPRLGVVTQDSNGYNLMYKELNVNKKFSLENHYNDDLMDIYPNLVKRLKKDNDKGIVMLYGQPGTGKTSFIRHLCAKIKNKDIIFLPPNLASHIADPSFIPFFMRYSNSILVIEDAEELIQSRDTNRTSAVSTLLNVSDGLLSDLLNIQIICTFNCPISNIDSALLRKGRIITKYEFKKLTLDKTKKILPTATVPMTLAEVFNIEEQDHQVKKNTSKIGFSKDYEDKPIAQVGLVSAGLHDRFITR